MKCGICGSGCRKTTLVYVKSGSILERKRAGQCCAGDAIQLVMTTMTRRCKCGGLATQCHLCGSKKELAARKDGAEIKAIIKRFKVIQLARKSSAGAETPGSPEYCSSIGEADGLQAAIDVLESGRW